MLIETIEQLDALPEDAVVKDRHGDVGVWKVGRVHYPETAPLAPTKALKWGPLQLLRPRRYDDADIEKVAEALAAEKFRLYRNTGSDNHSLARAALNALETTP